MNLPLEFSEITRVHPSLKEWRLYKYDPSIGTRIWEGGRNLFNKWVAPFAPQMLASEDEEEFFKAITGCFDHFLGSDVIEDDASSDPCYRRYVHWLRRKLAPSGIVWNDLFANQRHHNAFIFRKRVPYIGISGLVNLLETTDHSKSYWLAIEHEPQPGLPYCRIAVMTTSVDNLRIVLERTYFPSFKAFFRRFIGEDPTATYAERLSALCSPAYALNTVLKSRPATTYLHQLPLPAIERIQSILNLLK